ncbi:hypothetical protein M501DRAFT_1001429 [Patellaria atrata CBS 101060]|uniref:Uncharacterized protein n=1 Tax=Patellaria atrata CBS 101060 TaxID=1346257 RepID=A0A9P4S0T6_9PEZI|nr:hypothetical protein M501DRAFT_1001429 [Patellaria atrata CBS 101060]
MGRNDELSWNFDYVEALKRQTLPSEPSISDSEGLCVDVFLPQQLDAWEVSICNSGRAVNDEVPDSQSTNGVLEEPAAAFHTGVCEPSKTAFDHFGVDTIPSTLITEPESEIFDWESLVKIDEDTGFNPTEKMPHEEHQGGQSCRIGELDLMRGEGIAIGQSDGDDDVAILAMIEEYFKNPQVADGKDSESPSHFEQHVDILQYLSILSMLAGRKLQSNRYREPSEHLALMAFQWLGH